MVEKNMLEKVLKSLDVPEESIKLAMPVLLGQVARDTAIGALDMAEAMAYLGGVSRWTVIRAVKDGKLACVRLGRRVMFRPEDLYQFVCSHRVKARKRKVKNRVCKKYERIAECGSKSAGVAKAKICKTGNK